ncbi:DNA-binding Lrp family transcriptional regulator [Microbacterium natoriense]|uniref:DNA-binding Lrp family transcriptional regulator n=1 Tax=Microbacterium natoriense TaxID=284570 RepID=A0AAW8ERH2_9MICO|nr:winged helix-turn-helix transcriptional regulator [Microbacterium natoriense]MDQ0646123.1 DNA-binding Lrp family transcriptional regulator [Microbacterium natoriense]
MAKAQLDEVDLEILAILTRDAEITNKSLAHRLGLAESTCAHRVRALRERGVIRDTRIRVDGAALGFPLQAIIKVRLANHTGEKVTALFDALVSIPRRAAGVPRRGGRRLPRARRRAGRDGAA